MQLDQVQNDTIPETTLNGRTFVTAALENEMMKAFVAAVIFLAACSDQAATQLAVQNTSGLEGCIYREVPQGGARWPLKVVRCSSETVSTQYHQGKSSVTSISVEESARQQALSKLSDADKRVLGLDK